MELNRPLKIVLYGPPGAGKDTQAEALSKYFGIPSFSVGGIMRQEVADKTPIGLEIEQHLNRGEIAPGNVATRLLKERLTREDCRDGYVINGYPKTIASVDIYRSFDLPTHVFHLSLSDEMVHQRLSSRDRHDDLPDVINTRLAHYHSMEVPAFQYWNSFPDVQTFEVPTDAPIVEVSNSIIDLIESSKNLSSK